MQTAKELDPVVIGIKKKIAEKGLLKKAVALGAGFTEQQFSDMLNGRKIIKACDLFRIAEALDIDIIDLIAECRPTAQDTA